MQPLRMWMQQAWDNLCLEINANFVNFELKRIRSVAQWIVAKIPMFILQIRESLPFTWQEQVQQEENNTSTENVEPAVGWDHQGTKGNLCLLFMESDNQFVAFQLSEFCVSLVRNALVFIFLLFIISELAIRGSQWLKFSGIFLFVSIKAPKWMGILVFLAVSSITVFTEIFLVTSNRKYRGVWGHQLNKSSWNSSSFV